MNLLLKSLHHPVLLVCAFALFTLGFYLGSGSAPSVAFKSGFPRTRQASLSASCESVNAQLLQCEMQRLKDEKPVQDDPQLVQYAKEALLVAPNPSAPYNLGNPDKNADNSQFGQVKIIRDIFSDLVFPASSSSGGDGVPPPGFFIEVGAYDGEGLSNTLWFERNWGWTGLLVESDDRMFGGLVSKGRKAWLVHACLAPSPHPGRFTYFVNRDTEEASGTGVRQIAYLGEKVATTKYCVPLHTLLLALNQTVVDFFSLDIEGAELDILLTIPFDRVHFKVLTIETYWIPGGNGTGRTKAFLNSHGFKLYAQAEADYIFVHEKYLPPNFRETVQF